MQHERGCDLDSCFSLTCGLQPGETRSSLKKLLKCDPHGCWKPLALLDARVAAPLIRPLRPLRAPLRATASERTDPGMRIPRPGPHRVSGAAPALPPPPPREARREPPPRRATCLMAGAGARPARPRTSPLDAWRLPRPASRVWHADFGIRFSCSICAVACRLCTRCVHTHRQRDTQCISHELDARNVPKAAKLSSRDAPD